VDAPTDAGASARPRRARRRGALPGFGLSMGWTLAWLGLVVLIPMAALVLRAAQMGPVQIARLALEPRAFSAISLSFTAALIAAAIAGLLGLLVAWVLVRYEFPGRALLDAFVDLPFALPTAVAGIALTSLYGPNGWLGKPLAELGIAVAFTRLGIVVALVFVGIPFVVRTIQPVLEDLDPELEEAAAVLGAGSWTTFLRVILPALVPPMLTGCALAFARALGEYGSVVFISGNKPGKTEIVPLLIVTELEQYDYVSATALAVVMLVLAFAVLFAVNLLQRWSRRSSR
jgi:sulfate transport system permease protein